MDDKCIMMNTNNGKVINVFDKMREEYVKNGMSFTKKDVEETISNAIEDAPNNIISIKNISDGIKDMISKHSCSNCKHRMYCLHKILWADDSIVCNKYESELIKIEYPFDFLESCSQAKEQGCNIISERWENLSPKDHIYHFKYGVLLNSKNEPPELEAKEIASKWRLISE